ncbi:hypothetical protein [Amphiplicatus metriothermophilus]|uniref:Uncharacterized protein n=1 Tax=Amphiplicatus metriothermophilus TaxID=1519374 RepID=A0A239PW30_9PROT|nr:hypothetical protein [Amphiplicatus metriothermophilus]MBB5519588.1 hypothetical protein [Amphiplicatus metriothermophilus]SNT74152.1 hypothetical protein SAMN06297382_2060 [Amphiplicatus metriothermophilus]
MTEPRPEEAARGSLDQDIAAELSYVRALAEEGRAAPLVGGALYVLWGALTALAAFASWLAATGVPPFDALGAWRIWVGAGVAGWALSFVLGGRAGRKPGAATVGNRTANAAWLAVGIFITLFFIVLSVVHDDYVEAGVPRYFLFSLMFPVAFGLYGVAFFATAAAARTVWFRYAAFAAWGFSALCLFLLGSIHQMLAAGAGAFVCAVLPGIALMRREPKEIV